MRILITNDDGIYAPGLRELVRALAPLGEITVIAPERQQSATGHGITLHKPLRMAPVQIDAPAAEAFATNGTPADCTILATADGRPPRTWWWPVSTWARTWARRCCTQAPPRPRWRARCRG